MNTIAKLLRHEERFYKKGTIFLPSATRPPSTRDNYRIGHHPATKRHKRISKMIGEC